MKLDKESLIKVVDDNETIEFLEKVFSNKPEYEFLDRLNKNIKKQISTAVSMNKVVEGDITYDDFENSLKSKSDFNITQKGMFIKGEISLTDFYSFLSFLGCNNNPKQDSVNDSLIFYSKNYRIFVSKSDFGSNRKTIALLYTYETIEEIKDLLESYFLMVDESTEMTEDELIKLSYDVVDLPYTENYKDFNTNNDLLEIQDALFKTYERNPFDFIITLALIYRLRILGWDKQYINYVSENNKGFNILSAATNVNISKMNIEYLLKNNYINEDYNLTESGRIVLLLINHVSPVQANNLGNFYVPLSYYYNISSIDKNNFVNIKIDNQILYGIKDEFFVCKDALVTLSDKVFADDSDYNTFILNSTNNLHRGREIGYTPNINISDSESLDFEICQPLFNTFNNDVLDTLGGLIMIKPYNSKEPIYVNSLIFRLLKKTHYNISPFISGVNDEYVLFKDNVTNEIVGLIKTKKYSCHKEFIATQDKNILINKITNTYNDKIIKGLDISENMPMILSLGFIEKAQLSIEDFKHLLSVPFNEIRTAIRTLNKDNYFNDLNEYDLIQKVIAERGSEYSDYITGIKEIMNSKVKALEIILSHYKEEGNADKESYYNNVISEFKDKIDNLSI